MKRQQKTQLLLLAISILILSCNNLTKSHDDKWITEIKSKYPTNELIQCWFIYDIPVDGYKVSGRFCPFSENCETGHYIMRFEKGKQVFYYDSYKNEEVSTNSGITGVFFDESFDRWKNDSIYTFHYIKPDEDPGVDAIHPLGLHTPFQFIDVDFDNEKELMVSDYVRYQGGNFYYTYDIDGNEIKEIESLPIREIQNISQINNVEKTITLTGMDGAAFTYEFVFKKRAHQEDEYRFPEYPFENAAGGREYDEYQRTWKELDFVLESFKINYCDEVITYDIIGNSYQISLPK